MQIGAWKSYDELEENVTLDGLMELYAGIMKNKYEEFKNMARANGAKFDEDENEDPEAFNRVLDKVNKRKGTTKKEAEKKTLGIFSINNV